MECNGNSVTFRYILQNSVTFRKFPLHSVTFVGKRVTFPFQRIRARKDRFSRRREPLEKVQTMKIALKTKNPPPKSLCILILMISRARGRRDPLVEH